MEWAEALWLILALVWFALVFTLKSVKRSETIRERVQHVVPLLLAFWLVFGNTRFLPWLHFRLLPNAPYLWWTGVLITAAGMAIAIWARLTLGANWSGMVTLKRKSRTDPRRTLQSHPPSDLHWNPTGFCRNRDSSKVNCETCWASWFCSPHSTSKRNAKKVSCTRNSAPAS